MSWFKKKKKDPPPYRAPKVLILRFSSIGDIVLTTPVLRCLKTQVPEATLHYATKLSFKRILEANPYIDELITIKEGVDEIIPYLKKQQYTHILDLHHNLRTARIKQSLAEVPAFTLNKLNIRKWIYANLRINLMPKMSIVERYLATAKTLGIRNDGKGLDYFIPDADRVTNEDIPVSHWAGYIGCVIGGSYATKQLPVAQWKKFVTQAPYPIMLLGGPEDRDEGNEIAALDPIKVYNACGKFNINESADLVARAKVIVSNDTGLMHIAAAFQKPTVSVWGNTTPALGMFPYYGYNDLGTRLATQHFAAEVSPLGCRPCSKLGYGSCPRGHFKCMNRQNVAEMIVWVKKFWATPN